MRILISPFLRCAALGFSAGAAFNPDNPPAPAAPADPPAPPVQVPRGEAINVIADQAAASVAGVVFPQFSTLIQWAAQEEPIIFGLIYGLLHAKKQAAGS